MITSNLRRYVYWHFRDFIRDRGYALLLVGFLIGFTIVAPVRGMGRTIDATLARSLLIAVLSQVSFILAFITLNGIVSTDRKLGYYRFLFSKPVSIPLYYVQLFFVYLVALALAFALVATITRNINRMSRAAEGIARGDFSVRVNTRSRDQIGDLARSFDGMAGSIQRLLIETARKERLEGEIAVARTIQQKLLPPASAELPGARVLAHVQSVAEIGGDYYDYLPVPDGRSAIVVGDVSGHGLPTGLLVAMAKAALATLIETGLTGPPLFARLNDLIHRSTDSRSYMTLALFVYDATTRRGDLTNAGQLAPYRVSSGRVESLSLPSFPLGASPRSEFPTRAWDFAPGDRIVFLTDGLVECLSPSGDPFGFERFEAILAREAGSTPSELKSAILSEIETHTGGAAPDDDRTLVIVTLDPIEGPPPK